MLWVQFVVSDESLQRIGSQKVFLGHSEDERREAPLAVYTTSTHWCSCYCFTVQNKQRQKPHLLDGLKSLYLTYLNNSFSDNIKGLIIINIIRV